MDIMNNNVWKFTRRTLPIPKMNKAEVFVSAIECYKRMEGNSKRAAFCEYRLKVESNPEQIKILQKQKETCEFWLQRYANKLEHIDERAAELGIDLPEDLNKLREMYASYCEKIKKQKNRVEN